MAPSKCSESWDFSVAEERRAATPWCDNPLFKSLGETKPPHQRPLFQRAKIRMSATLGSMYLLYMKGDP